MRAYGIRDVLVMEDWEGKFAQGDWYSRFWVFLGPDFETLGLQPLAMPFELSEATLGTTATIDQVRAIKRQILKWTDTHGYAYCGSRASLTADHLIARHRGGPDAGDNLIWACRPCNTSKGSCDVLAWLDRRGEFPTLLLLRRYLKLEIDLCASALALERESPDVRALPIDINHVPQKYPPPMVLKIWIVPV